MRALVLAPQPFFTPRGTPFSVYHRTRIAAQLGVEADLLTYGEGEDVDLPGVRILRIPRVRVLEPIRVGPSFGKLVLDMLMVVWTIGLLIRRRYDFVHAHEEAVFYCLFLKPVFRFKLLYDMHSSLPQQLKNFEFTRSRVLISLFERLELAALKVSDAVVTISPALARYALSKMNRPQRHVLIENSLFEEVRLKECPPRGKASASTEPLPAGRPIVAYAGTLESYQGIDLLIEAHAKVVEENPRALLLLIGGSPERVRDYEKLAGELGVLDHCRFTGILPQSHARELLRSATVVVSPRTGGDNTPLKIYEQLASGIPLVATRVPSHTQILNEEICFLAPPDPENFSRALLDGLTNQSRRGQVVAAAKAHFAREYSEEAYIEKMARILELVA